MRELAPLVGLDREVSIFVSIVRRRPEVVIEAAQPVGGGQNEVDRLVGERTEVFREETTSDGDPPGSAPRDDTPGYENERQQPDSAEGGGV